MDIPNEFQLSQWLKEAKRLVTCTGCYGVGQKRGWDENETWELCQRCQGSARCIAEPHVVALIEEVQRLRLLVEGEE